MIQEIEIPEGKALFPFFVDAENQELAIECFASRMPVEYVLDDDGNKTDKELYTDVERAYKVLTDQCNRQIIKYQKKMAANDAAVISDIVKGQ